MIWEKELLIKKKDFVNLEQGPKSIENILHIVTLAYVPSSEKEIVKEYYLR